MNAKLLALYGLKWHPFTAEVPTEAIYVPPRIENFCWRIEQGLIREGGFAMIHGDPGTGKSVAMRLLAGRLARLPDVTIGAINHPQSHIADFYREMGDIFAVPLRPHNRSCASCARGISASLHVIAGAASKRCAKSGLPIWNQPVAEPCCSSTRPRR
jgi:hypothetical protein